MKELVWLGKPRSWNKDYRSTTLVVEKHTPYFDHCASLLAVAEDDIDVQARITVAPAWGENGIIVYQSRQSYMALGCNTEGVILHFQVASQWQKTKIAFPVNTPQLFLSLIKEGKLVTFLCGPEKKQLQKITEGTLPNLENSFSFGFYFANEGEKSFEASVDFLSCQAKAVAT